MKKYAKEDYKAQLQTEEWRAFRQEVFKVKGTECEKCGYTSGLQIHHPFYTKNKKAWEYNPLSMIVLCEQCHKEVHNVETPVSKNPFVTDTFFTKIKEYKETDYTKHVKIYMFEGIEDRFNFTASTLKVFIHIARKLQWNQDLIFISTEKYVEDLNLSRMSISRALTELTKRGFIAKYKRGYYWINPKIFFFGNRLKVYKNRLKRI